MFVGMWMTKEVKTATAHTPLTTIAKTMADHRIRRVPVLDANSRVIGLVSWDNVLHAFPGDVNPFTIISAPTDVHVTQLTAADVMQRDPPFTTAETPVEAVARLMCDRKLGALLVMRQHELVGIITESDIFSAFANIFDPGTGGVRITFDNSSGVDVFPLIAEVTHQHRLRVTSFVSLHKRERPLCVVQVVGTPNAIEAMLNDIWKSRHQVVSVIHVEVDADKI